METLNTTLNGVGGESAPTHAATETAREAARRLMASKINEGYHPTALHEYCRADGDTSHFVIRLKNDAGEKIIRPMMWAGDRWDLSAPPAPRPLYRLPSIINAPSEAPIFICEGENKVDALAALGLIATASLGGAGNAKHTDWQPLAGRRVVLWGDNDEAGVKYCADVMGILSPLGCSIGLIDVAALALPPKGDAVDWIAQHPEATADEVLALPLIELNQAPSEDSPIADAAETHGADKNAKDEAEIQRLAKLQLLDYGKERTNAAKSIGISLAILDKLVAAERPKDDKASGQSISFGTIEPWDRPVNGGELLNEIEDTIKRFVSLPPHTAPAIALWVVFTYALDYVHFAPILAILSPEKGCGKSTLIAMLSRLCARALPASNISPPAVFRTIEAARPTLLIDEGDSFLKDNEELRGVINSGHSRESAFVIRCDGETLAPRRFATWGAKAIAAIGRMPDTITDRSIIVKMARKTTSENIENSRRARVDYFRMMRQLTRWVADNSEAIANAPDLAPDSMQNRLADNWSGLFSIAYVAGDEWIKKAVFSAMHLAKHEDNSSMKTDLLADIKEVFEAVPNDYMTTKDLIEKLAADDEKLWCTFDHGRTMTPKQLANQLKPFGIRSKTKKVGYGAGAKSYFKADFSDAFSRYLFTNSVEGVNYPLPVTSLQPQGFNGNGKGFENSLPLPSNRWESSVVTGNGKNHPPSEKREKVTDESWVMGEV